jgi:hypothetical protein
MIDENGGLYQTSIGLSHNETVFSYVIVVEDTSNNRYESPIIEMVVRDNDPPEMRLFSPEGNGGTEFRFSVEATDNIALKAVSLLIDGKTIPMAFADGIYEVGYDLAGRSGNIVFSFEAVDSSGNTMRSEEDSLFLEVEGPIDTIEDEPDKEEPDLDNDMDVDQDPNGVGLDPRIYLVPVLVVIAMVAVAVLSFYAGRTTGRKHGKEMDPEVLPDDHGPDALPDISEEPDGYDDADMDFDDDVEMDPDQRMLEDIEDLLRE